MGWIRKSLFTAGLPVRRLSSAEQAAVEQAQLLRDQNAILCGLPTEAQREVTQAAQRKAHREQRKVERAQRDMKMIASHRVDM